MNRIVLALAILSAFGTAAAQTQAPKPAVLVHADSGAVQVQGSTVAVDSSAGANPGDVITVAEGQATLTYSNGCIINVSGQYTVPATPPTCPPGEPKPGNADGKYVAAGVAAAVAIGVALGSSGGGDDDRPSSP
jgi:hypothetical protein